MAVVRGLDLHRKQVTFDVVDTASGVCRRGRIAPADRASSRSWLAAVAEPSSLPPRATRRTTSHIPPKTPRARTTRPR
jgi:hypothetical protein